MHSWAHFPHEHAVFRAYQWGEDGLMGVCDSTVTLCLALALWNGKDSILKERLYGLTEPHVNISYIIITRLNYTMCVTFHPSYTIV